MAILRTYSAATAQLGPQAQWRFDEAGGAIAVDSADGLDGEYHGDVTFGQIGAVGADGAVRLGGNGSFVEIQSDSGGSFAVELAAASPTESSANATGRPRSSAKRVATGRSEYSGLGFPFGLPRCDARMTVAP